MRYDIQIHEVNAHRLAAVRGRGRAEGFVPYLISLLDEVWKFLRANPTVKHEGLNVFLYHGEGEKDLLHSAEGLPVVAGVKIREAFEGRNGIECLSTPAGRVVMTLHIGPYQKIPEAHAAVRAWCQVNHHAMAGPHWEIYGHWNADESQLQTEIFYLLV